MVYLKSFLAGVLALILSAFLSIGFAILFVVYQELRPRGVTGGSVVGVGWDIRFLFPTSVTPWIIALAIFLPRFSVGIQKGLTRMIHMVA
jgi:hypothetical protein